MPEHRTLTAGILTALICLSAAGGAQAQTTPTGPTGPAATELIGPPAPGQESATAGTPGAPAVDPASLPAADPEGGEDNVHGTSHDLLTDNGLRSPWCDPGRHITAQAQRNCHSGGLASSGAAGDNASFDRHVDTSSWTGAPKIDRWFISIVLTILSFGWTLTVTLTRGVFTALEFSLSFNPLDTSHQGSLAETLNRQVTAVTGPLALLLAPVGAVWLMWTTTVARRPGHAASQALLSGLLITGALLILANPIGTVGAALTASQRVGVAVIGATAGAPSDGDEVAQSGLQAMADGVIDQPLALLEFGDVDWGTNPEKLDAGLQAAALALAREENTEKVAAVRAARTNLDLVQVWPANSRQRNSINDKTSLLRVLCASDTDTDCKGPNARYAEFRTERGAWQRALGLVVILLGLIPFWIALLFVAVKIIAAGLMATVRLLQLCFLTPLALIGAAGNRRLTTFAADFAGNVLTAAAYSFFLGLIMLMWRLITTWPGYGFVMQWLLLALTLWQLIVHHKSLWGTANAPRSAAMDAGVQLVRYAAVRAGTRAVGLPARGASLTLGGAARLTGRPQAAARRANAVSRLASREAPPREQAPAADPARPARGGAASGLSPSRQPRGVRSGDDEAAVSERARAQKLIESQDERLAVGAVAHRERTIDRASLPGLRARRARLGPELAAVTAALPAATGRQKARLLRRQASLERRRRTVHAQLSRVEQTAQRARAAQENPRGDRIMLARRLDAQAALPRGTTGPGQRRQYPQLAALINTTPEQYQRAAPSERLAMRHRIDRELAHRSAARRTVPHPESPSRPLSRGDVGTPPRHENPRRAPEPRREKPADVAPQSVSSQRPVAGPVQDSPPGSVPAPAAGLRDLIPPLAPEVAGRDVADREPRPGPRTPEERREAFRRQARQRRDD